jgi:DNA-binding CsgD family transcriptional regulator
MTTLRPIPDDLAPLSHVDDGHALSWALSAAAARLYHRVLATPTERIDPTDPAVRDLIDAGFATNVWGEPNRLIALPPDIAIARAIANRTRQWLTGMPDFDGAQDALQQYSRISATVANHSAPLDTSEARQQAHVAALAAAHRSVCQMQPYPKWMPDPIRDDPQASTPAEPDALIRGVAYRYLYDEKILTDSHFRKLVMEEVDLGAQARVATILPTWMLIVDAATALYLPDPDMPDGAMSNAPGHIALLQMAFDAAWIGARPLDSSRSAADLTSNHREVLVLLIAGNGTETIARQLNINSKTVRRRIDDLCAHFDVHDRSTLVATAIARGG